MQQSSIRLIIKSLGLFLSIYLLLFSIVNWSGGKELMRATYKTAIETIYSDFGNGGEITIKFLRNEKHYDLEFKMTSKQQKQKALSKAKRQGLKTTKITPVKFPLNSWTHSSMFFIFLLSLFLATPIRWKEKLTGFAISFILLTTFILFKTGISLLLKFSTYYERFEVGFENKTMLNILNYVYNIIIYPYFGLLIVVLIWSFMCFTKIRHFYKKTPQTPMAAVIESA